MQLWNNEAPLSGQSLLYPLRKQSSLQHTGDTSAQVRQPWHCEQPGQPGQPRPAPCRAPALLQQPQSSISLALCPGQHPKPSAGPVSQGRSSHTAPGAGTARCALQTLQPLCHAEWPSSAPTHLISQCFLGCSLCWALAPFFPDVLLVPSSPARIGSSTNTPCRASMEIPHPQMSQLPD